MRLLTADQLAEHLINSTKESFPRADTIEVIAVATVILFLKRIADQPGICEIRDPEPLRTIARSSQPNRELSELMKKVVDENHQIFGTITTAVPSLSWGFKPAQTKGFANSFADISLSDDKLQFPATVGVAYDRFLSHVMEAIGKRGAEISTPDSIAELMLRITSPEAGESVCDPFAGLGGFLALARGYVREASDDTADVDLFGQEIDLSVWFLAKLNLLLHGIRNAQLLAGDTLADPGHKSTNGRLMLFDRVVTHAPFSMNYDKRLISNRERMRYGLPSEHGRADLLIVQHVLAILAPAGRGVVLAPLGVLFRGGPEAEIRRGMIEDDRIDAVIGLGPNILPGTGIPACIIVLRGLGRSRWEKPGDVLFINAEPELTRSRGINHLDPKAIEKIVDVFSDRATLPGFSRVVSVAEITDTTDFNLSVRPYTDQGLPAEMPADAAAIISGGVPRREVEAVADRFAAFGIDPITLFFPANPRPSLTDASGRLYFYEEGYEATAAEIGDLTAPREDEFAARCQAWWDGSQSKFTELAGERKLLSSRPQLIEDFASKLISNGLLGEYQLRGAFAAWWSAWRDDLQVLEHYGFQAVLDQWLASGRPRARTIRGDPSDIVLDLLGTDLAARTQALVVTERQKLVDTYLWWGERYGTSLLQLEAEAQEARGKLEDRFRELGYMDF